MERLTKRELIQLKNDKEIVACNYKDEDCDDSCMYGYCKWNDKALKKLKEYEDLEEQGMLIKFPCEVGEEVWRISTQHDNYDESPYKIVSRTTFRLDMLGVCW